MINTITGLISDLHLYKKTVNIERAISKLHDIELLLIIGDIADRAEENQYDMLLTLLKEQFNGVAVYCVSGNYDNAARDDTNYRLFERKVNNEYTSLVDDCGAFYKCINEYINDGSICPTIQKDYNDKIQQGNVTLLVICGKGLFIIVKEVHTNKIFKEKFMKI